MAPRAPIRELVFVPGLLIGVENVELAVARLSQRPRQPTSDKLITLFIGPHSARMRILLPGVGDFHPMAKKAFVASDVGWNRLADMILRVQTKNAQDHKDYRSARTHACRVETRLDACLEIRINYAQASRRGSTRQPRARAPRFISEQGGQSSAPT